MQVLQLGGYYNIAGVTSLSIQTYLSRCNYKLNKIAMKYPTFICCLIMIYTGCRPEEKPEIIEFTTYTKSIDSSISLNKMRVYYNLFFLVKNFSANKEVISTIDSFATNFLGTSHFSPNREEVRLWFYKESSKTNIESIFS